MRPPVHTTGLHAHEPHGSLTFEPRHSPWGALTWNTPRRSASTSNPFEKCSQPPFQTDRQNPTQWHPQTPLTRRCKPQPTTHIIHPQKSAALIHACLSSDLLRRLNPKHTAEHLANILTLAPDLTEDLLSSVDQPLAVRRCKQTGRDYLLCDYNRDGDSYRSPWSNQFDPPLDEAGVGGVGAGGSNEGAGEGAVPGERVRKMEVKANEAFDVYRDLYYEGGVSSVYLWNLDDGFAGVVLLKKGKDWHSIGIQT